MGFDVYSLARLFLERHQFTSQGKKISVIKSCVLFFSLQNMITAGDRVGGGPGWGQFVKEKEMMLVLSLFRITPALAGNGDLTRSPYGTVWG